MLQIYTSGCSGNVTAGKYNDGNAANRPVLAERIYQAMATAWKETRRQPLVEVRFRNEKVRLEPRDGPGFTVADLTKRLQNPAERPFGQVVPHEAEADLAGRAEHVEHDAGVDPR